MKQYTKTPQVPAGYWVDARGVLTPVDLVKEVEQDRDQLVGEIIERAKKLNAALLEFKNSAFADIQAFVSLSAEKYGASIGGKKGNVTLHSYDGRYKIQQAHHERLAFDERLQAAKGLIDVCLTEWTKGARSEVRALIDEAFQVDKQGEVSTQRILRLRRLDIEDERWQQAMRAIDDAVQVVCSKRYIRIYERTGDSDQYVPLSLDLATV